MIKPFAAVAAGGAAGAVLRYLISLIPFKGDFPFATLIANLLGALAIGFISGFAASGNANGTVSCSAKQAYAAALRPFQRSRSKALPFLKTAELPWGLFT